MLEWIAYGLTCAGALIAVAVLVSYRLSHVRGRPIPRSVDAAVICGLGGLGLAGQLCHWVYYLALR